MTCIHCGTQIHAVIHENIGRAWLHQHAPLDRDHEAEPLLVTNG